MRMGCVGGARQHDGEQQQMSYTNEQVAWTRALGSLQRTGALTGKDAVEMHDGRQVQGNAAAGCGRQGGRDGE